MSDVFRALHEEYYYGGADGYVDTDSGWITRFWGVNTGMVSYVLNHAWVYGTQTAVNDGDQLGLFVYANTMEYSICTHGLMKQHTKPMSTQRTASR